MSVHVRYLLLFLLILGLGCKKNTTPQVGSRTEATQKTVEKKRISLVTDHARKQGLQFVESVIYDTENRVFYASNGKEYKPGNDGFISKIDKKGDVQELKWIAGLNRPTGMAIYNNKLYVADVNTLLIINTTTGKTLRKLKEPLKNSGLNDVAVTREGEVFVTASSVHAIFKVSDETLQVWVKDEKKLKWANGILAENERILVAGLGLSAIDITSGEITEIPTNPPVKDFDGITPDGSGGYFLTTVENSALWHSDHQYQLKKLEEDDAYFGDLQFVPELNAVFVAKGNAKTADFFIGNYTLK